MNSQTQTTAQRKAGTRQTPQASAPSEIAESERVKSTDSAGTMVNGPAAAAILAAGIGCFAVGLFALAGDAFPPIARLFTFYAPSGPLSGVTTSAIVAWLLSWFVLARSWGKKSVALGPVVGIAFVLLFLSLLLTFPPFMDLIQGK